MAAVRLSCLREEWPKGQGKKVDPSAVAAQAIEAQPSFGQIKPWRGRVVRAPNSILGRRRGGRRTSCTRGSAFQAKKRKPWRSERTDVTTRQSVQTATPPMEHCLCRPGGAGQPERSNEGLAVPGQADEPHSPHRYPTDLDDEDGAAHPSLVAPASGNDAGPPATRRSTCGGTNSDMRAQAVPPTRTAPTIAKASRQPSDGTPIWASPNVAW